jgi:hypothetical protein
MEKLHNEKLHISYSFPDIIMHIKSRRMRWVGHVARMAEGMKVYRVLVVKSQKKNLLENQEVDGIRLDLREIGWGGGGCAVNPVDSG